MKTLAISNYKGGVGKTTSTANIGAEMARSGLHVLLVDLDPQGSLSYSLGAKGCGLAEAMTSGKPVQPIRIREGLDLVPSDRSLVRVELDPNVPDLVAQLLKPLQKRYDVVLLDCPPHMGVLHLSALALADHIVTPMEPEVLGVKGYRDYMDALKDLGLRPGLVFVTKYDSRKAMHRTLNGAIRIDLGDRVLDTVIRVNVALAEAPAISKTVREYSPNSTGAADYASLAAELVKAIDIRTKVN